MLEVRELHGTTAPSASEARAWIGNRVEDVYGAGVGRVEDVITGPDGRPTWLIVREGRFNTHEVAIPFEGAVGSAGHVWVPYSKDAIKSAPALTSNTAIEGPLEEALREHYGAGAGGRFAGKGLR
jgi:hypothetical protein